MDISHYIMDQKRSSIDYVIPTKSSAQNGISTGELDMEIHFKTGHKMASNMILALKCLYDCFPNVQPILNYFN